MKYLILIWSVFIVCRPINCSELQFNVLSSELKIEKLRGEKIRISIDNMLNTIEGGLPSVPVKTYLFALESGSKINKIYFEPIKKEIIKGELAYQASQVPICRMDVRNFTSLADTPQIKNKYYPEKNIAYSFQTLYGVPIVVIRFYPVIYDKEEKLLIHYKEGLIKINYSQSRSKNAFSLYDWQKNELKNLIENKEVLDKAKVIDPIYDYLIITDSSLINDDENNLKILEENLSLRGLQTKIIAIDDIKINSQGNDIEEKIRNTIKKEHVESGIRYVLLVGDGNKSNGIPARKLWSKVRGYLYGNWVWIEENIPSDFYYSCLDGNFNENGNDKWGEPNDGPGDTDIDLLCEVTVGRASIENKVELQNFVRKTIQYDSIVKTKSTLLLGEELFSELGLYGDDYMNQLIGDCKDHNFETSGYPTDWIFVKLYDRVKKWTGNDVLNELEKNSFSMVNHLGHSYKNYNMKLYSTFSTPSFKNKDPFFYYTQGCFPGDFTYDDSFIEKMIYHENGAVAAIANTSYGLAPEDPEPETTKTPGASQMLHRKFIDGVFSLDSESFGIAHKKSKEFFIGLANFQEIRWVFWVANYFGDPSLNLN